MGHSAAGTRRICCVAEPLRYSILILAWLSTARCFLINSPAIIRNAASRRAIGLPAGLQRTTRSSWSPPGKRASSFSRASDKTAKLSQTSAASAFSTNSTDASQKPKGMLPRGDHLDRMVIVLSIPAILNFMLVPLVGAADTFWVGKMGNAAALAGQGAANQVYSTTFWVLGFLPSVITPLVAGAYGKNDMDGVRKHIGEALFLATFIGTIGMALVLIIPRLLVSVVIPSGAPAMEYGVPYILARGVSFVPAMLTTVGFATFRGTLDTFTPLMVSAFSNLFHIALLPIFVLKLGLGVVGAGLATCISDFVSCSVYLTILLRKKFIDFSSLFRVPSFAAISELMNAGFSVQLRTLAMNSVFIVGSGRIQAMDYTGTAAAAHTIATQLWSIGGVILLAVSTVAAILVPKAMATASIDGDLVAARHTANRMLIWGLIIGCILAAVQLSMIPLLNVFTPLHEVREAARVPFTISAAMQIMNGVVFVGEGVMQGHRAFRQLAVNTVLAMVVLQLTIPILGTSLPGVWCSYFVFNVGRLIGVLYHHFYQVHPPLFTLSMTSALPATSL